MNPLTVLVMPVHNALPYVQRSLQQLVPLLPKCPLIIVNDSSEKETADWLVQFHQEHALTTHLLHNSNQQLFTRTVNRGLRKAYSLYKPQSIAVVNSDCDLKEGWLEAMQQILHEHQDIGLVGYRDGTPEGLEEPFEDVVAPTGYVTGHLILLRTQALLEVGVFCETELGGNRYPEYTHWHGTAHIGSDRDLSYRMRAGNWRTVYCNFPGVEHQGGQSWGSETHVGHCLGWLASFNLIPMWEPNDSLDQ